MARTLSYAPSFLLVSSDRYGDRVASSRRVSTGHAVPADTQRRGRKLPVGWSSVLVARVAAFPKCGKVVSLVHGFIPLPGHVAL
jgi:hypothetical protein